MFGAEGASLSKVASTVQRTYTAKVTENGVEFFTADVYDAKNGSKRTKVDMISTDTAKQGYTLYKDSVLTFVSATTEDGENIAVTAAGKAATAEEINTAIKGKSLTGQKVLLTFSQPANVSTITISADQFPGTYYITGDTYSRSDTTGEDQFFQFIIQKAKITSENTITLEADGDPSVFNLNLTVLRPEDGEMMKLVQYDLAAANG